MNKPKINFRVSQLSFIAGFSIFLSSSGVFSPAYALSEPIFLDAIVASIDDKPIALSDVTNRMKPPHKLTIKEASENPDFNRTLDAVILEQLVELEAAQRRITVSDAEINDYLSEIAKRNSLSRDEFLAALKSENRSETEYRAQVKIDILRSKLASSLTRGAVAVSDEEIDAALSKDEVKPTSGATVTLRQILISTDKHNDDDAQRIISQLQEKLSDGEKFDELASSYSESPEATDGGSLGTLPLGDLQEDISLAVQDLDVGDISDITHSPQGYHLFLLEERNEEDTDEVEVIEETTPSTEKREQIRNALRQKKLETKMAEFFTSELYKLHSVDKKI
jgi:peptidyl-prolyl cis-trans isomerase SurA